MANRGGGGVRYHHQLATLGVGSPVSDRGQIHQQKKDIKKCGTLGDHIRTSFGPEAAHLAATLINVIFAIITSNNVGISTI